MRALSIPRGIRGLLAGSAALAILVSASPLTIAAPSRSAPTIRPVSDQGVPPAADSLVFVVGLGNSEEGTTELLSIGVVVDEGGLILVSAGAVAPDAPGLAATYAIPNRNVTVDTILVGSARDEVFGAEVVAVDGYMDVAIIEVDSLLEEDRLVPLPAGAFDLPAVSLATDAPVIGDPVTYVTFDGGVKALDGAIDSAYEDERLDEPATWFTDIDEPGQVPGGALIDGNGVLSVYPTWYIEGTPSRVFGTASPFITPLLDAALVGDEYVSPYDVPGTGQERMTFETWSEDDPACPATDAGSVTRYPSGATRLAALFGYSGFTDGEDLMMVWADADPEARDPILAVSTFLWGSGPEGECFEASLTNGGDALPDGDYAISMYGGGQLRFLSGATTKVGGRTVDPTADVVISGRVIDADTGRGLRDVAVVVLAPGTDLGGWLSEPDDAAVVATAVTGRNGRYETRPALSPETYGILFLKTGYQVAGGTIEVEGGPVELEDIALAKES